MSKKQNKKKREKKKRKKKSLLPDGHSEFRSLLTPSMPVMCFRAAPTPARAIHTSNEDQRQKKKQKKTKKKGKNKNKTQESPEHSGTTHLIMNQKGKSFLYRTPIL
jgi:hypothetical protein